jgi:hypothetical protein
VSKRIRGERDSGRNDPVPSGVAVLNADRIGVNNSERGFVDYLTDPAT